MSYDIRHSHRFSSTQHCTYEPDLDDDNDFDYTFSHTAQYCGRPQPRFCACAYDYEEPLASRWNEALRENTELDEDDIDEYLDEVDESAPTPRSSWYI